MPLLLGMCQPCTLSHSFVCALPTRSFARSQLVRLRAPNSFVCALSTLRVRDARRVCRDGMGPSDHLTQSQSNPVLLAYHHAIASGDVSALHFVPFCSLSFVCRFQLCRDLDNFYGFFATTLGFQLASLADPCYNEIQNSSVQNQSILSRAKGRKKWQQDTHRRASVF